MDYPVVETDMFTYMVGTFTGTATVNSATITMIDSTSGISMPLTVTQVWSSYCRINSLRILKQLTIAGTLTSTFTTGVTMTVWVMPAAGSISGSTTYTLDDNAGWVLIGDTMSSSSTSTRTDTNTTTGVSTVLTPTVSISLQFSPMSGNTQVTAE